MAYSVAQILTNEINKMPEFEARLWQRGKITRIYITHDGSDCGYIHLYQGGVFRTNKVTGFGTTVKKLDEVIDRVVKESLGIDVEEKQQDTTQNYTVLTFGKYNGMTLQQVAQKDISYLDWGAEKLESRQWRRVFAEARDQADGDIACGDEVIPNRDYQHFRGEYRAMEEDPQSMPPAEAEEAYILRQYCQRRSNEIELEQALERELATPGNSAFPKLTHELDVDINIWCAERNLSQEKVEMIFEFIDTWGHSRSSEFKRELHRHFAPHFRSDVEEFVVRYRTTLAERRKSRSAV